MSTSIEAFTICPATNSDIPEVRNLVFSVLREYGLEPDPGGTDVDLVDLWLHYFEPGGVFEVVRSADGELLGTVGLKPWDARRAELRKMYVKPGARGQGLGKRLLVRMIIAAEKRGFAEIWLETNSVLKEAVGLYESFGFVPAKKEDVSPRCDQVYVLRLAGRSNVPGAATVERRPRKAAAVPTARVRLRFGVRTMLLLFTVYIGLFTLLQMIDAPPALFVISAGWLTAVGLGQVWLFGGRRPRTASILVGVVAFGLPAAGAVLLYVLSGPTPGLQLLAFLAGLPLAGAAVVVGGMAGYAAGGILAAVFLVSEEIPPEEDPGEEAGPWTSSRSKLLKFWGLFVSDQPILSTARLILRPLAALDAPEVQRLAGHPDIASTTLSIPHPYENGMAEQWIADLPQKFAEGRGAIFAIVLAGEARLIGTVGLTIDPDHVRAELGYWIGKPYWGNGYATEAAAAVVRYGLDELNLNRIFAHRMTRNPASGRVLEKIGMKHEGRLRQHIKKWGVFEDVELYSVLTRDSQSTSELR